MRLTFRTACFLVLVLLTSADHALAWGPAMHIGLASSILDRLSLLPAAVAAVLARNSIAYLYGNIAADVVFAKRWSRVKQFCHHWSTGFSLLRGAGDERSKAFAYGYLSHLAADTVAHGKYVPHQILVCACSQNFGHFYWELRADSLQSESTWGLLEEIIRDDHAHHHAVLRTHITDTLLSYPLNRLLFDQMNALTVRESFRRTIHTWGRFSRWELRAPLLEGYREESIERIFSILTLGERSLLVREDPNGTSALMHVRVRRAEARRRRRSGIPLERRILEASVGLAPRLGAMLPPREYMPSTKVGIAAYDHAAHA